jgi:predicted KAP-like P-loop ATPase
VKKAFTVDALLPGISEADIKNFVKEAVKRNKEFRGPITLNRHISPSNQGLAKFSFFQLIEQIFWQTDHSNHTKFFPPG